MVTLVAKAVTNVRRCSCQVPIILFDLKRAGNSLTDFSKTTQFVQRQSSCFIWTDGLTVMTKLIVVFINYAKAPRKSFFFLFSEALFGCGKGWGGGGTILLVPLDKGIFIKTKQLHLSLRLLGSSSDFHSTHC